MGLRLYLFLLLITTGSSAWAIEYSESCGKEWEWRNPLPQGNSLNDIAWSGEQKQWLAVGDGGTILSSSDGIDWQQQNSGTTKSLQSIVWNGSTWMAVGFGTILASSDGVNWQEQYPETFYSLHSIAWNGNTWIAVGLDGTILSSSDGIHWQAQYSGTYESLNSIVWNGNTWMAVGEDGTILASSDGVNWKSQTSETNKHLFDIVWNGITWIAVGMSGTIVSSSDGVNWQAQSSGTISRLESIAWNGSTWIAAGPDILTSSDGIKWEERDITNYNNTMIAFNWVMSIAWNGIQWMGVGLNGAISSSSDGVKWQEMHSRTDSGLDGIAWNGSTWMTVGEDGTILSSNDGMNWQAQYPGFRSLKSIAWNGSTWMAVGWSGTIVSSSDGVNWQAQSSGTSKNLWNIAWNSSTWMAVGDAGTIVSSSDGVNWQAQFSGTTSNLESIAWNGNTWIAVGWSGTIVSSSDGVNWQAQNSGTSQPLESIAWNGSTWMAVGWGGTIVSSNNGEHWLKENPRIYSNLRNIAWNGSTWMAVGSGGTILSSSNGFNWQAQNSGTSQILESIAWNGEQWVAVGWGGTILASPCSSPVSSQDTHAIIVAGGGDPDDPLWEATNTNANFAYQTLRYRGIDRENIRYFNAQSQQDVDGDGDASNDIYAAPSSENIQDALLNWAGSRLDASTPLLLYLVDHGGQNVFYVDKPSGDKADIFDATQLSGWLDTLQQNTGARVTTVYDACNSGSFMDELKIPEGSGFERINIFSTKPEQAAYFGARGRISFSNFFWSETAKGHDVRNAFRSAQVAVRTTTGNDDNEYQSVVMDDNGDGRYDTYSDGSLAKDTHLGINAATAAVFPEIIKTQGDVTLRAGETVTLRARVDLPEYVIKRTWAVVVPPDSPVNGSNPITNLPVVELQYNSATDHYEGTLSSLTTSGRYILSYFTQSNDGRISSPVASFAMVTGGNAPCVKETAYISLNDLVLHIGTIDYQPILGEASVFFDVGLQYRQGSNPLLFDLAYAEQSGAKKLCTSSRASLAYDGQLTVPSLRVGDTGNGDIILDNLKFRLIPGGGPAFELLQ